MASKDTHFSYVDGIKVKISEQYKPPPRIILPITYSQRLTMNDQIRKSIRPQYDFNGERSIKLSLAEWKIARKLKQTERVNAFEVCRKEMETIDENVATAQEQRKTEQSKCLTGNKVDYNVTSPIQTVQNNILIPTIAGINLQQSHNSMLDKSPFNVSDFDPDTSSPFDNMALKSINDLEELALVLNKDKGTTNAKSQPSIQQQTSYHIYNYNDQNTAVSTYNNRNGYYQHDMRPLSQPVNHNYPYPRGSYDPQRLAAALPTSQSSVAERRSPTNPATHQHSQQQQQSSSNQQTQHRTVPLIMRSIQQQLENTHLQPSQQSLASSKGGQSLSHSQQEQLENPFGSLEVEAQTICKGISSMGFPLARVARASELIGNDDKKIVEFLLVMSDLMDLGFSETNVSTALVKCNNDKDKALEELLIS